MTFDDVGFLYALTIMLVLAVSFIQVGHYLFKMTLNRKPGVPFAPGGQWAGNIVLRPQQLTDKGLKARKRYIIWLCVFMCTLLLSTVVPVVVISLYNSWANR